MKVSKVSKQQIIEASRQAFLSHGFRSVRVEDIAQQLAISKKTVYQHFSGKEELVRAVVLSLMDSLFEGLSPIFEADLPALKKIDAIFNGIQVVFGQIPRSAPQELARLYPRVLQELLERRRAFLGRSVGVIAQGQQAGEIRTDFSAESLTAGLIALVDAIGNPMFLQQSGLQVTQVLKLVRAFFVGGLSVQAQEVLS